MACTGSAERRTSTIYSHFPVYLLLMDRLYNTRSGHDQPNSGYDYLSKNIIVEVVELAENLMSPGGHGRRFCFSLQFHQ